MVISCFVPRVLRGSSRHSNVSLNSENKNNKEILQNKQHFPDDRHNTVCPRYNMVFEVHYIEQRYT